MNNLPHPFAKILLLQLFCFVGISPGTAQSWDLIPENIEVALRDSAIRINNDPFRPGFHLTPPAGSMGDPNGGIYHNGWYHIFYGLQPFSANPGRWYWAHARSKDLLHWEHLPTGLTPGYELGLHAVGSGSTIITKEGNKVAFHSESRDGTPMMFWKTEFLDDDFIAWKHSNDNPVLTLKHSGLPSFDRFWRDPFVFIADERTFLIACADLFDEDYVPVPIFEAQNNELTEWEYKGILFSVPKHKYRNLEVPDFRQIGDKWLFMASTDAPVDRTYYFVGEFDLKNLKFNVETEGPVDYSGHFYALETIEDDKNNLFIMAWIPGWDRNWLPTYMNEPLKNNNPLWNGCFSLPRKIILENGMLIQKPVESLNQLRQEKFSLVPRELAVASSSATFSVVEGFHGNQLEIIAELDLFNASFCGMNVLCNHLGQGGLSITWSGNVLNVDGVIVPIENWNKGDTLKLQVYVDKKFVEVFVNDGKYCITRQVREENVKGSRIALTTLGGTAKLISFDAWRLKSVS